MGCAGGVRPIEGGVLIKLFMLVLFTAILMGCSQENTEETPINQGPPPFTDEEITHYVEDNDIEMEALLNTSDNSYAAILGEHELHQIVKDDNEEIVSHVQRVNGDEAVELGALNSIIYAIVNDEELLEKGHMLKITHDDGELGSELFRSEETRHVILYDTSSSVDETVSNVHLYVYDDQENVLYQETLEE